MGKSKLTSEKKERIYKSIKKAFLTTGAPPTYRDLKTELDLSSTSLFKPYIKALIREEKIEIYNRRLYLFGLREKVMDMLKEKDENEATPTIP